MSKIVESKLNNDPVNHPSHYETNGIECIDAMIASQGKESVISFCLCNAFKYIWRCKHKKRLVEDLQKAQWYLNKAIELITGEVNVEFETMNISNDRHCFDVGLLIERLNDLIVRNIVTAATDTTVNEIRLTKEDNPRVYFGTI